MRFAIDAHAIGQHLTGNEIYIRNLLQSFCAVDPDAEFVAYIAAAEAEGQIPRRVRLRWVSPNPFARLGWQMAGHLRADAPSLVHVQYTAPLACPVPVVVSVHDVSFLERPEFFSAARVFQLRRTVSRTVNRAARILAPSDFSRRAIEAHYPTARGKTHVVANAVSPHCHPIDKEQARARVRAEFGIASPFLLNVGDLQPRKNQTGLIHAFSELLRAHPLLPHRLVLVGQSKWAASAVRDAAVRSPAAARIHFTGWVNDDQLRLLYNACEAFVFPSFYEGFGIPILEAMACGAPVACSDTSAMPEVADGAALFFNPQSIAEMVRGMRDLALDAELRARLSRLGQQRAAAFSWDHAARRTLKIYYEVAGAKPAASFAVARPPASIPSTRAAR